MPGPARLHTVLAGVMLVACRDTELRDVDPLDAGNLDAFVTCDPLVQSVCAPTQKCAWIHDQTDPDIGHIGCAPDGSVPEAAPCTFGVAGPEGYSNCTRGTECVNDVCERICNYQGGPPQCDATQTCTIHFGLFDPGVVVAGVCEPT